MSGEFTDGAHLDSRMVSELVTAEAEAFGSITSAPDDFVRYLAGFRRARRRRRLAVGAAVIATIVGVGFTGSRGRTSRPTADLSYRVDDQNPPFSGYVSTPPTAESVLAFSDG